MRLTDLDPVALARRIKPCGPGPDCSVISPHTEHEVHEPCALADCDGIMFLCPKCFAENGGPRGTHVVICWRPRVPPDVDPKPGRWEIVGSSFDDLSLVAGSSSVLLRGGCNAHFFIEKGAVRMC